MWRKCNVRFVKIIKKSVKNIIINVWIFFCNLVFYNISKKLYISLHTTQVSESQKGSLPKLVQNHHGYMSNLVLLDNVQNTIVHNTKFHVHDNFFNNLLWRAYESLIGTKGVVWIDSIKEELLLVSLDNRSWLRCFRHKELTKNPSCWFYTWAELRTRILQFLFLPFKILGRRPYLFN